MERQKQEVQVDELIQKRIAKFQWKKDAKHTDDRAASFIVDILYGDNWTLERYDKLDAEGKRLSNWSQHASLSYAL